ncbi:MAG: hypothetical protein WBV21_12450, partial [Desulfobacterales bacterium]
ATESVFLIIRAKTANWLYANHFSTINEPHTIKLWLQKQEREESRNLTPPAFIHYNQFSMMFNNE